MAPHMHVRLSEGLPHFILNHFRADSWVRDPSVGLSIGSGCSAGRELPFNVATPFLIRLLASMHNKNNLFAFGRVPAILTFQHEVAHRMTADPIDPERCRLSVMCQNYANVEYLFTLPGEGFFSIYSVSHDWGRIKAYFFMVYLMVNKLWVQLCLPPFFATCLEV